MQSFMQQLPIVTLSAEDNAKLSKLLSEGSKRTVYWNEYNVIGNKTEIAANSEEKYITELLNSSCQGVKRLFVLAYNKKKVIIKFLLILIKNIFFQDLKQKITTLKLMEEIFMTNQLMIQLNITTKSEKYQQDKVIIAQLVLY